LQRTVFLYQIKQLTNNCLLFQECIQSWMNLIIQCQIPCTPNFSLVDCLIDHVKMRAWNLAGLPNDKYSLDNGIITTHTTRWPVLIDPQGKGLQLCYIEDRYRLSKENNCAFIYYLLDLFRLKKEQGLKWILEIESKNQIQLIRYDESDYLTALAQSITCGRTVVMVNVKDKLNPELGKYQIAK